VAARLSKHARFGRRAATECRPYDATSDLK
jgi:hypothetical protein